MRDWNECHSSERKKKAREEGLRYFFFWTLIASLLGAAMVIPFFIP